MQKGHDYRVRPIITTVMDEIMKRVALEITL